MTRADARKAVHAVGCSLVVWILLGIIAQGPTDHLIDTKCLVPFEPTKLEWLVTWPFDLAWAERAPHAC